MSRAAAWPRHGREDRSASGRRREPRRLLETHMDTDRDTPMLFDLHRGPAVLRSASLSPCGLYRYWLTRGEPDVCFVMCNPSTADHTLDDPTVRRCFSFARRWGFHGFVAVNLCAYRSTDPAALLEVADPVGPENDRWIRHWAAGRRVILAWGATTRFTRGRERVVLAMLSDRPLECLGTTADGSPRHPVRLHSAVVPVAYRVPAARGGEPSSPPGRTFGGEPAQPVSTNRPGRGRGPARVDGVAGASLPYTRLTTATAGNSGPPPVQSKPAHPSDDAGVERHTLCPSSHRPHSGEEPRPREN